MLCYNYGVDLEFILRQMEVFVKYKNRLQFMVLLGILLMLLSYCIAEWAGFFQNPINAISFYFIVVCIIFAVGLNLVIQFGGDLLFGSCGEPNYTYKPKMQQIFVKFNSTSFEIERDGIRLELRMLLKMPYTSRKLFINGKSYSGNVGSDKLTTADGQVLYFFRYLTGIKVFWLEENNPWKIVEK